MTADGRAEVIFPESPVMNHDDRCDRCGAQAWVAVMVDIEDKATLRFCCHHYSRHESRLIETVAFIVDERFRMPK